MRLDDVDIARRFLAGDPSVFEELSTDLWPTLAWRLQRESRRPLSAHDLADLRQEWLLRAHRNRGQYDPARGSLPSWLATIAFNMIKDQDRCGWVKQRRCERTNKTDLPEPLGAHEPWAGEDHAEDYDEANSDVEQLLECMSGMPERQQELLYARYACEGEPPTSRELAERFHSTPAAVRMCLCRAVAKVRREVGNGGAEATSIGDERGGR